MLRHHNVLRYVSILVQVRLSGVKKIPQHCDNLTLELVGRRLSIKRHETLSSPKNYFSLSENLLIQRSKAENFI